MRLVGETVATGAVPVPVKLTVWGLPLALSVMLRVAVRDPLAAGAKVTLIVQLPPATTELPHVFVWAKSPTFVPLKVRVVTLKAALPELVRVTACAALLEPTAWLEKVRLVGERLATGAVLVPVPVRLTDWGLSSALSTRVSEAVRVPVAEGVNVISNVQPPPGATQVRQLLD